MAMREIEIKILESVNEFTHSPKFAGCDQLMLSAVDYAELFSDERRAADVIQVLSEVIGRPIEIIQTVFLKNGEFKWKKGK